MAEPITISNDGPVLIASNFWQSEWARRGLYFLSINAGAIRLLMPPAMEHALGDMQTAREVILTRGLYEGKDGALELLFDDASDSPYAIFLDPAQADRRWLPSDEGKRIPFVVYLHGPLPIWQTTCRLRRTRQLPYLKAWGAK
jgi:hypothetical protein